MRNEMKRQMRKEIREELRSTTKGLVKELLPFTDAEWFMLSVNSLWYIDRQRTARVNQVRSAIVEKIVRESSLYSKILAMRRDQKIDKKQTAKIIKKALEEQGWTEEMVTEERDRKLDMDMVYHAFDIAKAELAKKLEPYLETLPIYNNWLEDIDGISVLSASKLLRLVGDITRFSKPSSLWHYAGLHVVNDKAPKPVHGKPVTWNPKLRALLLGIMGDNFIKQGNIYRQVYDKRTAKTKRVHPEWWHLSPNGTKLTTPNKHPKHGHKDAVRVMIKRFLLEFWIASYQAKGLQPPRKPYSAKFHPNEEFQPLVPYS